MEILKKIRPRFWDAKAAKGHDPILFNYRRIWFASIFLLIVVSLVPLGIFMIFNFSLARETIKTENHLRTARITSNTRRTISYYLEERMDALTFIIQEKKVEALKSDTEMLQVLRNLQMGFGGYIDLGLIDSIGLQINYAGPFELQGKAYGDQDWFQKCVKDGAYISDVFMGYRKHPHMILAVKWVREDGPFHILRTTLDIKRFIQTLSSLDLSEGGEAFLCNHKGIVQTPSKYYGELFQRMNLSVPEYSPHTQVIESTDQYGNPILIGYSYIENSPFVLMLVKRSKEIMKGWYSLRDEMLWLFFGSTAAIFVVILGTSTFMLNKVYDADQTRLRAMERLESSSRLISVGRLAAGVAHEINNPLAVINENAGLIKDLFILRKEHKKDEQLMELIDAVLESVERAGQITKQLLGFARHFEPKIAPVSLGKVVSEVLSFHEKEAQYRNISIDLDIPEDVPLIYSDHGRLQQIFLNLINNAFQAMSNGGRLHISARGETKGIVSVSITDNGHGISSEDQKRIFEPFFTTKGSKGGAGLGLSITYGLVRKLRGDISVRSVIGVGTTFVIVLPINFDGELQNENPAR
jgi:signal transduction histidine kinase